VGDNVVLMAPALDDLRALRADILAIAWHHGATNLRVFGSVARGQADDASDLDLLVDMEPGRTLGDLVELEQDLSVLLGCRVDVGTKLQPRVSARVRLEAVPL
jgi:hypothetical protein